MANGGDKQGKFQRELENLSSQLNFPEPTYRTNCRKPTKGTPHWSATVYIGEASFNSFPEEKSNDEEAKELAAEKACNDFRKRIELLRETTEKLSPMQEALKRIEEMVNNKPNGIFADAVEDEYIKKYGQRLPDSWKDEGAINLSFEIDSMAGNRSILYPVTPEIREAAKTCNNIEINGRMLADVEPTEATASTLDSMDKLELPVEDEWDVYVTSASSPGTVWVRLVGDSYDGMYDVVLTEMELHMMDKKREAPQPIVVNGYYSVYLDKCWLRAQVSEIFPSEAAGEEDMVDICLIDNGEIDTVPVSSLYVLEPTFAVLPAQAIRCRLAFAEVLGEDANVRTSLLEHVGQSFVAEVVQRGNDNQDHAIILFDTSVEPAVEVNFKLINEAFANVPPPKLPAKGCVAEMMLGSVNVKGPVYVYLHSNAFKWTRQILDDLAAYNRIVANDDYRPKPAHLRNPRPNCMFLAKSKDAPEQWRRATIIQASEDLRTVDLFFVDYGNVETVPTPDILLLEEVCPALCKAPKQAILVELNGIPSQKISPNVVSHILKLAPVNKSLLGKVTEAGNGDLLPVVSLFVRLPPDGILASINDNVMLTMETSELKLDSLTEKVERSDSRNGWSASRPDSRTGRIEPKNERPDSRNGRSESRPNSRNGGSESRSDSRNGRVEPRSENKVAFNGNHDKLAPVLCRGLSAPLIPEVGQEFFQVYVTIASNPDLFVVQPCSSFQERQEMMVQLQKECNSNRLLPPTEIRERNLYAARHNDQTWYRVSIVRKDSDSSYTVYMCDFGDMAIIPAESFLRLDEKFRKLPYQAIRAKLTGIKPVNVHWSPEDCKEFQRKTIHEYFQAQVSEKAPDLPDLLNCQDSILGLKLLDTRDPNKDVSIADWLVEKGRAQKM